jgi:hypothetical protein
VNKAGATGNLKFSLWMTYAEKLRGDFDIASGNIFYATSPLSYSIRNWQYAVVTFDGPAFGLT